MAALAGDSARHMRFWLSWEEHEPFLLRLCQGWVGGNESEARELLSSAMLKAWEGAQKMTEDIGNYRAWLARIVRNHCIDQQRRQNRDPQVKTDPELLAPIAEGVRVLHQPSPEATMLKEESYARILARMDHLPLRLKEVMMLRAYQNMSYKEIGQRLRISTENARKRVQMARSLLRATDVTPTVATLATAPQEERAATEAILDMDRGPSTSGAKYAAPVLFEWQGMQFELPVLLDGRPMRLAQKTETLRKYLDRHPGGWKKELELARLLWAMGDAQGCLARLESAFERQGQEPEVTLTYLRLLQALGAQARLAQVAAEAVATAGMPLLEDLYTGFAASAQGSWAAAETAWRKSGAIGGTLQLARLWLRTGRTDDALALLQDHLRLHPMEREAFLWLMLGQSRLAANPFAQLGMRRFPHDPYATTGQLVTQWSQPDLDHEAMQLAIDEAQRLAPASYLMMALRAAWAQRLQQFDRAHDIVAAFLEAHPLHWQGLHFALRLAEMQGNDADAAMIRAQLQPFANHELPEMALDLPLRFLGA